MQQMQLNRQFYNDKLLQATTNLNIDLCARFFTIHSNYFARIFNLSLTLSIPMCLHCAQFARNLLQNSILIITFLIHVKSNNFSSPNSNNNPPNRISRSSFAFEYKIMWIDHIVETYIQQTIIRYKKRYVYESVLNNLIELRQKSEIIKEKKTL